LYVESLARNLMRSYQDDAGNVRLESDVAGVFLGIDTAIPCGLIVNELVSNALKHAFPGDRAGRLRVYMRQRDGMYVLEVSDDGAGMTHPPDVETSHSMGLQLVTLLTEQLDGTMSIDTSRGTKFRITFKDPAGKGDAVCLPEHNS
jgi:two-component sensor histidine kinase